MFQEIDQLNDEIWLNGANDPNAAFREAEKALKKSKAENYLTGEADSLFNMGRARILVAELEEAKDFLSRALDLFRSSGDERAEHGEMRTLNALGVCCFELQEYENALNYYFMALTQTEFNKNDEIRILTLNNIGEIHRLLDNHEEALSYYHQALNLAEHTESERAVGTTDVNLGEIYLALNDLTAAEEFFNNAVEISEKQEYLQMKADALLGLGKAKLAEKDPEAEGLLNEAVAIFEQLSDRICIADVRYQLGLTCIVKNETDRAEELLLQAEKEATELNQTKLLSQCMQKLSELCKDKKDYKKALEYYERFNELKQSLENEGLRNRLRKITILYETEQTETEKEAYRMQSLNLEKTNKEIKLINEIGQEITSSLDLDEIIYNTFAKLSELIDVSSFGVALYDEEAEEIHFTNIVDIDQNLAPFTISAHKESSLAAWCIRNREPVLINSRKEATKYITRWKKSATNPSEAAIFMPMIQRGRMVGCLTVQNIKKNIYTQSDLDTVGAVATFLAIALDNSKTHSEVHKLNEMITSEKQGLEIAYQRIAHMANHDSLTDLPNRHLLSELIERGIEAAKRTGTKLAVLYMDLDNFKPVNDSLGHNSGDEVLRIIASRLTKALRTSDTIARIGGDEFVAVLQNINSLDGVEAVSNKIIKLISKEIELKGKTFQLGVSIGAAVYPDNAKKMESLLLRADKAMYRAKHSGKNRTEFYDNKQEK